MWISWVILFSDTSSGLLQNKDSSKTEAYHSYSCTPHHTLSLQFAWDPSLAVERVWLILPSCLLKAVIQHSGSFSPVSLLSRSSVGVKLMWMVFLSKSLIGCLAMSITWVSSRLMLWWSSIHAPLLQTSLEPLSCRLLGAIRMWISSVFLPFSLRIMSKETNM